MLAFVHIGKAAGITINWILRRSFGLQHCDVSPWRKEDAVFSKDDYRRLTRLYPRIDSISGHKVRAYSDLHQIRPDVQYFTFLRDPLIRSASGYQYFTQMKGRKVVVEQWIGNGNSQSRWIAGTDDLDTAIRTLQEKFIFVGLVEHFDESLVMFQRKAADRRLNILYQSRNVAPKNTIKNELLNDPRTKSLLVESHRIDLALYEFVRDELYPQQRREYGKTLDDDVNAFRMANSRVTDYSYNFNLKLMLSFLKRRLLYRPVLHLANLQRSAQVWRDL